MTLTTLRPPRSATAQTIYFLGPSYKEATNISLIVVGKVRHICLLKSETNVMNAILNLGPHKWVKTPRYAERVTLEETSLFNFAYEVSQRLMK